MPKRASQVEEAIEAVQLVEGLVGGEGAPGGVALGALHAERAVVGAPPGQVDLGLGGHLACDRQVARQEGPVVAAGAGRGGRPEAPLQGALAGDQGLDEPGDGALSIALDHVIVGRISTLEIAGSGGGVVATDGEPGAGRGAAEEGAEGEGLEVIVGGVAGDADEVVAGAEAEDIDGAEGALQVEVDDGDEGAGGAGGGGEGEELGDAEIAAAAEETAGPEEQDAGLIGGRHGHPARVTRRRLPSERSRWR
jgi:hypothetical protein